MYSAVQPARERSFHDLASTLLGTIGWALFALIGALWLLSMAVSLGFARG